MTPLSPLFLLASSFAFFIYPLILLLWDFMTTEILSVSSFNKKLVYFLLLRSFFKKTIYQGKSFRIKVESLVNLPITVPKGPFAHKKSKEQFTIRWTRTKITLTSPLALGVVRAMPQDFNAGTLPASSQVSARRLIYFIN